MTIPRFSRLLVMLAVGLFACSCKAIRVDGNGYELTVAISDQIRDSTVTSAARNAFLQTIRDTVTRTSSLLFQATDQTFYFKRVNILLPREWTNIAGTGRTAEHTYANADVRVEETFKQDGVTLVTEPRTINLKPCGQPGEHIILSPQFFLDSNNSTTMRYGDKAKVLVHEFARYRYGVHEEYGYPDEHYESGDKFPYSFINTNGFKQVTSCNDSVIIGDLTNSLGENCTLDDVSCRFRPNLSSTTGPTSSLMSMQFVPTVNKFCDSTTHDRTAPNKQNYWCRNRSVKTVIRGSQDFVGINPLPSDTPTTPVFSYLLPVPQTVYIVMDVSANTLASPTIFNNLKQQIRQWLIPQLALASPHSYVGIATMGGTNTTANDYLGGYLIERQPPVPVQANQQKLVDVVNSIGRSSAADLLLEKVVLDVGDILTPFTYQSGSIALLAKLSTGTYVEDMDVESEAVNLLNSRNVRLVTIEYTYDDLSRITSLTGGSYFSINSNNYFSTISTALSQVVSLVKESKFQSRRIQLSRGSFAAKPGIPAAGRNTIDWRNSDFEIHFYIPENAIGFHLKLSNGAITYNESSPEYRLAYRSWNQKYFVHSFTIYSTSSFIWDYEVTTEADPLEGFVEAVEVLPSSAPLYIGGGGTALGKPLEIQVFTSGRDGILSMSSTQLEDQSFMIYTSLRRGYTIPDQVAEVVATVLDPRGQTSTVVMRDDSVYPDTLRGDGVFSGRYIPLQLLSGLNKYRISLRLEGMKFGSVLDFGSYSIPIDQGEYCCGQTSNLPTTIGPFQRVLPYVATLWVQSSESFAERPLRIMDFHISSVAPDDSSVSLTWTAPADSYGSTGAVASYQLVYSAVASDIIDDELGMIPSTAPTVNSSDILSGSLTPLPPGTIQSVTVQLRRAQSYLPLFFTIGSTSTLGIQGFPAPMKYIPAKLPNPNTEAPTDATTESTESTETSSPSSTDESTTTTEPSTISSTELTSTEHPTESSTVEETTIEATLSSTEPVSFTSVEPSPTSTETTTSSEAPSSTDPTEETTNPMETTDITESSSPFTESTMASPETSTELLSSTVQTTLTAPTETSSSSLSSSSTIGSTILSTTSTSSTLAVDSTTGSSTTSITRNSTSMPTTKGSSSPTPAYVCQSDGIYANPYDCSSFYQCSNGQAYLFPCPSGLYFNPDLDYCDYPANVPTCPTKKPARESLTSE